MKLNNKDDFREKESLNDILENYDEDLKTVIHHKQVKR